MCHVRRLVVDMAHRWEAMWAWLVVLAYAGVIFYLSSQSEPPSLPFPIFPGLDKIVHACEFGLLSLLLFWAIRCSLQEFSMRKRGIATVVILVLYGISDEIHQTFVPMRHGDPFDVLADAVGAVCALIALRIVCPSRCCASFRARS